MNQVPYSKVERLYKRLFQAERVGDVELQAILKRELNAIVTESTQSREEIVVKFYNHLKDKAKKTFIDLDALLHDSLNEVDTAIEVSSLITQSLLLMKRQSFDASDYLDTVGQVELLGKLLRGEAEPIEATRFYQEILSPALEDDVEESSEET